jgi:hypothetical protein
MKLIQKITNSHGSIMLLKISETHYEVCKQSGNNYITKIYNDLLTALNAFNLIVGADR